ncbi:MAG: DNA polymerase III subunit delta [Lachnospiraceae bacterium]|nr:DNA polymerase III subunit delta [Lachnospiraceae bacterium]
MRKINQDIKNQTFQNIYLLYGEEAYLKKQYKDRLKAAVCGEDTMNYAYFEGKNTDVNEIISIADTMPFFAEKRLVVIENSGFFKKADEKIVEYLSHVSESTILVFVEEETDKRGKMFKKVKELGYVCELAVQTLATLGKWIVGILNQEGKKITKQTLDYFLSVSGTDMNIISNELEKLISYTMGREEITQKDISEVCSVLAVSKIFDMVDAMGNKNRARALEFYYDMIEVREPPMRILYMLSRQFRMILEAKELFKNGMDRKAIAEKLALAPFIVNKVLNQSEKFRREDIKRALEECLCMEEDIKNGRMEDKTGVEMILIKYSTEPVKG